LSYDVQGSRTGPHTSVPLAMFKERIILCEKAAPRLPSPAAPTCVHALGSLSHCVEHVAPGYITLPAHPAVQPPVHVRDQYYNPQSSRVGRSTQCSPRHLSRCRPSFIEFVDSMWRDER